MSEQKHTPEKIKALADQFICHPVSRSIDEIEMAGGMLIDLLNQRDELESKRETLESLLAESRANDIAAMGWLADCRFAVGDNGKRMLPEFVDYLKEIKKQRDELLSDGKQFVTIQDCRDGVWAHFRVGKGYAYSINLSADKIGIGFAKEFIEAIASVKGGAA